MLNVVIVINRSSLLFGTHPVLTTDFTTSNTNTQITAVIKRKFSEEEEFFFYSRLELLSKSSTALSHKLQLLYRSNTYATI